MKKIINVNKDESGDQYFILNDFADIIDVSKVVYYNLEKSNEKLILTFFDKEKNQLLPKKDQS